MNTAHTALHGLRFASKALPRTSAPAVARSSRLNSEYGLSCTPSAASGTESAIRAAAIGPALRTPESEATHHVAGISRMLAASVIQPTKAAGSPPSELAAC